MEAGLKDCAAGVEQLVDKVVTGDLGGEVAGHMDRFVSGFIRHFENNYSKFEAAVKQTFRLPARRVPPPRRAKVRSPCCVSRHARRSHLPIDPVGVLASWRSRLLVQHVPAGWMLVRVLPSRGTNNTCRTCVGQDAWCLVAEAGLPGCAHLI